MARNNLRLIYNNIVSSATLTATNADTKYPVSNLLLDNKGLVFRSNAGTPPAASQSVISCTWSTNQAVSAVVLPYTNLKPGTDTVRIQCYSDTAMTAQIYDSGVVTVPAQGTELYANTRGSAYRYSFGGGSYFSKYFTKLTTCKGLKITCTSNYIAGYDSYVEVGRVIVGDYWSPTYNTEFGLSVGIEDSSTSQRAQNGALITDIGTSYKTLSFNLNYLTEADRTVLFDIIRSVGTRGSLYVSLFPEDDNPIKEYTYQIYGRLTDLATISHPMYTMYASTINIQEV